MEYPFFFGYGSLVNRKTHSYPNAMPARARGWARRWAGTRLRQVAYLSVVPDGDSEITGLIAGVPGADWAELDLRERAYLRHPVEQVEHDHSAELNVQIYALDRSQVDDGDHPILLSYIDTVIEGFVTEFGQYEAEAFFETTQGWELSILDDRDAPIYPRATSPGKEIRLLVDRHLSRLGR